MRAAPKKRHELCRIIPRTMTLCEAITLFTAAMIADREMTLGQFLGRIEALMEAIDENTEDVVTRRLKDRETWTRPRFEHSPERPARNGPICGDGIWCSRGERCPGAATEGGGDD